MHKNNLALETDCTWGVPIVEEIRSNDVEKPKKPKYHQGTCIKRDPVSISHFTFLPLISLWRNSSDTCCLLGLRIIVYRYYIVYCKSIAQ